MLSLTDQQDARLPRAERLPEPEPLGPSIQVPRTEDLVRAAIAHMRANLSDRHTLGTLAEIAGCSPFTLIRLFRRLTGITPMRFLTSLRLAEAKRLLLTTEEGVIHVCYEVGYESLGSFNNRFRALTGLTPSDLRQRLRGLDPDALRDRASETGVLEAVAIYRTGAPFAELVACAPAERLCESLVRSGRYEAVRFAVPFDPDPRRLLLQSRALRSPCLPLARLPLGTPIATLRPVDELDPPVLPVIAAAASLPDGRGLPARRAA
ncbi:AraC family transcriptional regulator [Salinarimonas sp.]|uniref:AraC family transcriptional regulator n=1 Tax=Salinarimonas sp. TaxID=2766526 RepID=UPI0032D8CC07